MLQNLDGLVGHMPDSQREVLKSLIFSFSSLFSDTPCTNLIEHDIEVGDAVLLQVDDQGFDRPVCYFSKKFNKHQFNYSTIEKEALALVWALLHFDVYVGGGAHPVVVFSDHNPLTFLHSLQNPNQHLMRWALFLQPYHLQIYHIRGVENVMADALSRAL
jgi:hypothetical protein